MNIPRIPLPGSDRQPIARSFPDAKGIAGDLSENITVTVHTAPGESTAAYDGLAKLADTHTLGIQRISGTHSGIWLNGTLENLEKAFGVRLAHVSIDGATHRVRSGPIYLPEELEGKVTAVLGLDNRPAAYPRFHVRADQAKTTGAFTLPQLIEIYKLPVAAGKHGAGRTIAIIELGGGYTTRDLTHFFESIHQPMPEIVSVDLGAARNSPGDDADLEVLLDIEIAGAICSAAKIEVYFAENTEQGFVNAIHTVALDGRADALSISWGAPEDSWTPQAMQAMSDAIEACVLAGITVTVAAGDSGYTDGDNKPMADFPCSSPYALACGGTALTASNGTYGSEVVWGTSDDPGQSASEGATGGGFSSVFVKPHYQAAFVSVEAGATDGGLYRGVPDVSAVADPNTGYIVVAQGKEIVVGGTSAVAPLWAALTLLLNEIGGKRHGLLQPALYSMPWEDRTKQFHIIKHGNNGFYQARNGWSACCGLGTPQNIAK